MRLIDADALLDFLDVGHLRPPTEICFSELMMKNIIDIQPTIEAIPIEWLKEHIVTIEQEWILEDWEREHEIN